MITVLVVDDHEVVRLGLMTLLRRQPTIEVVGEAGSGKEAVKAVEQLRPRVVVMDVRMPDGSGIEACREIVAAWPQTRVLMLTSFADDNAAMASVMAGAAGYMLKQMSGQELLRAIETVAAGGSLLDPMLASKMLSNMRTMAGTRRQQDDLTEQERNVLQLVGEGKTNREIAQTLFLTEKTVRNYVSNVLQKLGFESRSQAAAYAARRQALEG
ncbi:MAG TPA: response regulator transcription factor [Symbiobacteriaceae bacterium]|nr:response regulator transcription factor [Symbiobacteriaceae bacterium]